MIKNGKIINDQSNTSFWNTGIWKIIPISYNQKHVEFEQGLSGYSLGL